MREEIGFASCLARLVSSSSPDFSDPASVAVTSPNAIPFALTIADSAAGNSRVDSRKTARIALAQEIFTSSFRVTYPVDSDPGISAQAESDKIYPKANIGLYSNSIRR